MRAFMTVAVLVIFATVARSQPPATESAFFTFGSTRDEAQKVVGAPQRWYVPEGRLFLSSLDEYLAALKVYGPTVEDVYARKTATNEYLIRVGWLPDTTTSRLHPTERLRSLYAEIDKPGSMATILKDFAEAAEVCKAGCDLYGVPHDYVLAFPSKPTTEQLTLGARLATNFKEERTTKEWCVAIKLNLEHAYALERKLPDWNGRITSMTVAAASLYYEVESRNEVPRAYSAETSRIGTWSPTAGLKRTTMEAGGPPDRPEGAETELPANQPALRDLNPHPPKLISKVEPEYSAEARKAKYQATVLLSAVIGADGVPRDIRIVVGAGLGLDERAIECVSKWRYEPEVRDGKAIPARVTVEVNFRLF